MDRVSRLSPTEKVLVTLAGENGEKNSPIFRLEQRIFSRMEDHVKNLLKHGELVVDLIIRYVCDCKCLLGTSAAPPFCGLLG